MTRFRLRVINFRDAGHLEVRAQGTSEISPCCVLCLTMRRLQKALSNPAPYRARTVGRMLILSRFLDVCEYELAPVMVVNSKPVTPIKTELGGFRINLVRLATAIAKTMHCAEVRNVELPFMVAEQISALQRHTASFPPFSKRNLRLTDRHFGEFGLRDFSKTSVEGQYAQGLSFLFAQDYLGIPALIDFDRFCIDMGIAPLGSTSSRPDFVACQNSAGYWLVESKGSLESDSVKPELRKGVNQCLAGAAYLAAQGIPAPKKTYTTLASFRTKSSRKSTRLCYVDPDVPEDGGAFDPLKFLRAYYERVLEALGYADDATRIWTEAQAPLFRQEFESLGGRYYQIASDDRGGPLFWALQDRRFFTAPDLYSAGVAKKVIDALVRGNVQEYFALIPGFQEQVSRVTRVAKVAEADLESPASDQEFFVDGTVVQTF